MTQVGRTDLRLLNFSQVGSQVCRDFPAPGAVERSHTIGIHHILPAILPLYVAISALQSSLPHHALTTTDGYFCAWRRWRAAPLAPRSAGAQRVPKGLCCRAAARARARVVFCISL